MKAEPNQVALVTGANRGLGLQTARELGRLGIRVILGSRDLEKGVAAARILESEGIRAEAVRLDVSDAATHAEVRSYLENHYGKLDILVNNAGIRNEGKASERHVPEQNHTSAIPMEALRETFEVNFFGTVALTLCLLPLIRKAPAGRIVNVSSILASLTTHSNAATFIYDRKFFAYDASKTALNAFTVHLAHELKNTAIKVNSAHPGWVRTDMGGPNAVLPLPEGAKTTVRLATLPADGPTGGYFHLDQHLPW